MSRAAPGPWWETSADFAEGRVGEVVDVLVDKWDEEMGTYVGRTALEAPDIDPVVFLSEAADDARVVGAEVQARPQCLKAPPPGFQSFNMLTG